MKSFFLWLQLFFIVITPYTAEAGAPPPVESLLERYDEIMGPPTFESDTSMSATREDGSTRTYRMKVIRGSDDKYRIWFSEPASVKGQEILRQGDNTWVYLPNLKRASRIANRDSFQGGDFNNADVLRTNYREDYEGKLVPSETPDTYLLELKAKHAQTAYDAIKLWIRKVDRMPVRGQYFGTSGQLLRSAEFADIKQLEPGFSRPTKITMRNELVKSRSSQMIVHTLRRNVTAPAQRFTVTDLGR
jgi:outer membrane lipoprotein-sorting protein